MKAPLPAKLPFELDGRSADGDRGLGARRLMVHVVPAETLAQHVDGAEAEVAHHVAVEVGQAVAQASVAGAEAGSVGAGAAAHRVVAAGGGDGVDAGAGGQHVVAVVADQRVVADAGRQVGDGRPQVALVEQRVVDVALGDEARCRRRRRC